MRKIISQTFDIKMDAPQDPPPIFSLSGIDEITIHSNTSGATAWTASTITFEVSNQPARGYWENPPSGSITVTAAGITDPINVTPYMFGRFRVTSTAATSFRVLINVYGEGGD